MDHTPTQQILLRIQDIVARDVGKPLNPAAEFATEGVLRELSDDGSYPIKARLINFG